MSSKIVNDLDAKFLHNQFVSSKPFHHVVIENFLNENFAIELKNNFPTPNQKSWWIYDNPLEKKLAFNNLDDIHPSFRLFFNTVNSTKFLSLLEDLTGLKDLKSDATLNGGGLHLTKRGGKLDIHEDFNINRQVQMLRKVNLILYLNESWEDSWGGHLELWDKDMNNLCEKISPIFNRAVIFRTDMNSNHGHPHPLECPPDVFRISLATYYYQKSFDIEKIPYKSTSYKKLPGSNDGLDGLRELRSKGRLQDIKLGEKC